MPGHATAAIVAYPGLGTVAEPPAAVSSDWGVFPYLYNVDDKTFAFLEDVLTETMALFPGTYIHVGGDEAVKDQWQASPVIQAKMRALGLANEDALQSWFIQRVEKFLNAHGRRLIGWDEILQGGIAPNATITSWRGIDGAVAAAKAGHDAVLSPAPVAGELGILRGAPLESIATCDSANAGCGHGLHDITIANSIASSATGCTANRKCSEGEAFMVATSSALWLPG